MIISVRHLLGFAYDMTDYVAGIHNLLLLLLPLLLHFLLRFLLLLLLLLLYFTNIETTFGSMAKSTLTGIL